MAKMRVFPEQKELIQYARRTILQRIGSLENDVRRCIFQGGPYQPAPFAALLYCFSVIDLLGAFLAGNAKPGRSAEQAREYMQKFMGYTEEQAYLLQMVFRHKLVHLSEPRPIMEDKSRRISWQEWHNNREKHLAIEPLKERQKITITSILSVECDHVFHVGIWNLVEDIRISVEKPNGYFESLEKTPDLQDKFEQSVSQMYDYK